MSTYLNVGDQPWYCFWNSTISEFWIFLDQDMQDNSTANATITSASSMPTSTSFTSTQAIAPAYTTSPPTARPPPPTQTTSNPSTTSSDGYWNGERVRRAASSANGSTNFPKLVKMLEKRKPSNNVQPYCQQMQVLNNWQIVPIPTVATIAIVESESVLSASPTATSGGSRMAIRKRDDATQQLGSNCICEWFSV